MSSSKRITAKFFTLVSLLNAKSEYKQVTHFSGSGIELNSIWRFKPDVIFIHNWFNLLNEKDIIAISQNTPTIFVAHDCRLATGGCHVTLGCEQFKSGCKNCPAAKIKTLSSISKTSLDSMFSKMGKYAFVSPSFWLINEINEASIVKHSSIRRVIRNPINVAHHNSAEENELQQKPFKILFVAASLDSKYKGFEILIESINLIDMSEIPGVKIELDVIGNGRKRDLPKLPDGIQVSFRGQMELSNVHQAMSSADLLIVPSVSDNYPGVIVEAQILGCVVAASAVGGLPEIIEHNVTGYLFEPNAKSCAETLIMAINSPHKHRIRRMAQERAINRHSVKIINQEYEELMKELLAL
jgi:glycosyltransferase involved in cell wall biosynthesis